MKCSCCAVCTVNSKQQSNASVEFAHPTLVASERVSVERRSTRAVRRGAAEADESVGLA